MYNTFKTREDLCLFKEEIIIIKRENGFRFFFLLVQIWKKPVTGNWLSLSLNYSKYVSYLNIYKFGRIADPELSEYKLFCRIWVCTENCFRES